MTYTPEVAAALSGASVRQLAYWRSGRTGDPLLRPRTFRAGSPVQYSFEDVVALRTIVYLRARGVPLQRIRKAVVALRELGAIEHSSRYRLLSLGQDVVWRTDDDAVALTGAVRGQQVIAELVDVLEAFEGHDGNRVVALAQPVPGISVDRDVLAGFPVVEGTRVPYAQVAGLIADGVPPEAVSEFYPSVTAHGAEGARVFADLVAGQPVVAAA
ncbi:MAG: DUF433 domain-containing protein [Kineosporiaceae bacterium]